jgi:hypothetical protein
MPLFGASGLETLTDCGLIVIKLSVPGTLSRAVGVVDGGGEL